MSPGMGWDTGCVLLGCLDGFWPGAGTAAWGDVCPTAPHSPVCTCMCKLTTQQPAHTPRAAPGHTLPLHTLPADTYTALHTLSLYSSLPSSTVPVHSCPTALPAPQDTPHQCTPHHPTVSSSAPAP